MLSGYDFESDELADLKSFLSKQIILDFIPNLKDIIIQVRSKKKIKLPDAIIAATAIYFDIPLISTDKGFNNIEGLKFFYTEPPAL